MKGTVHRSMGRLRKHPGAGIAGSCYHPWDWKERAEEACFVRKPGDLQLRRASQPEPGMRPGPWSAGGNAPSSLPLPPHLQLLLPLLFQPQPGTRRGSHPSGRTQTARGWTWWQWWGVGRRRGGRGIGMPQVKSDQWCSLWGHPSPPILSTNT